MNNDQFALFGLLFALAAVLVWGGRRIARLKRQASVEMRSRYAGQLLRIDESANYFGLESLGVGQARGNGCLALSPHDLHFVLWFPHREVHIPRRAIRDVDAVRSHLGKSRGVCLLHVTYEVEGRIDSVAWAVRDLEAWLTALAVSTPEASDVPK